MSTYYLDTSALVKLYVAETGSAWMESIAVLETGHLLLTSRITSVEVTSALARRWREGTLAHRDYADALQAFRYDLLTRYRLVEVDETVSNLAMDLVDRYPLRAYDGLQLASALVADRALRLMALSPLIDRLVAAARSEGLFADNPNRHP
ncbi:MAG: type II toxin-antitoxin system VapC family toxin [Anaerolineae bacterium]|jgi:predicted nucleic acid-binding protein